jgi:mRNA interferase MazF
MNTKIERGEIYVVDLGAKGSQRPCLVLHDCIGTKKVVVPVTKNNNNHRLVEVANGWYTDFQPLSVDPEKMTRYIEKVTNEVIDRLLKVEIERGDVLLVNFGDKVGLRLCVVVQNKMGNMFSPTTIIVPLVKYNINKMENEGIRILEEHFRELHEEIGDRLVLWELQTIDKSRVVKKVGSLKDEVISEIDQFALGIMGLKIPKEVYWVSLPKGIGSEQSGLRPCLVIQNDKGECVAIPITKAINSKSPIPTHVVIDKEDFVNRNETLEQKSIILWEQPKKVHKKLIKEKIGRLNDEADRRIDKAAKISLGLVEKTTG